VRLGFAFGAGWYLNYLNARIVSINPPLTPPPGGPGGPFNANQLSEVAKEQNIFMTTGFGGALIAGDNCQATYLPVPNNKTQVGNTTVTDTVVIKPFVLDSVVLGGFFSNVQGINGVTFVYTTTVLQEEKGQN